MENKIITARMIDTGNGCFISDCKDGSYGTYSRLKHLYFDGKQPEESYKSGWFYITCVSQNKDNTTSIYGVGDENNWEVDEDFDTVMEMIYSAV